MRRNLLTTTGTSRRTRSTIGALTLATALLLGACSGTEASGPTGDGATTTGDAASSTSAAAGADAAGATVDVDALPDPVAEVNGEPISRADFAEVFEQQRAATQQGQEAGGAMAEQALRDAVLESMVSNELLAQEAERLDLRATDAAVDEELDSIAEQSGLGSGDEFVQLLAEQGVDEAQVREEAARLVLVDQVVQERGPVEPPTRSELRDYYEELTAGADGAGADGAAATGDADAAAGAVPAFEEVEDLLAEQLTQERENEAISTILEELEKDAQITRHL